MPFFRLQMLYRLANQKGGFTPKRYFSIDRVFRNETMDATHLCEFHQVPQYQIILYKRPSWGVYNAGQYGIPYVAITDGNAPAIVPYLALHFGARVLIGVTKSQQVEGLVADRNLCLGDLIGVIKTFFHKIGITRVYTR